VRERAIGRSIVFVIVAFVIGAGCATTSSPTPPRLDVRVDDAGVVGTDCGARVDAVRGPRPEGTQRLATIVVTADRSVTIEVLEQAAMVQALSRCATGLSVLRAEAADGVVGVVAITAVAWTHGDVVPATPSSSGVAKER
jgi:hypothetical protein